MDRINLRLPPETFRAIDDLRERRAGSVSRNTWIAEAITEKLEREASGPFAHSKEHTTNA
jgi:metal-responsive CopG/Arc/MetJ family transcriptional regulator